MWATGERLLDPGDGSAGFMTVDGLQGTNRALVQPQNIPPTQSWYIDYDDGAGYVDFRGHMGAIAMRPCPVAQTPPPPPPPPVLQCPPGTYFDGQQCIIIPTCPPGTSYANGQCVYPTCPPGFVLNNQGQCIPPPQTCPPGTYFYQGQCVPLACPPGMLLTPNGQCACPTGTFFFNGKCVPPAQCPPNSIQLGNGICICPLGLIFGNGVCTPSQQGCPPNQELWNGYCVLKCPPNQIHMPPNGVCQFPPVNCPPTQDYFNGLCVNKCPAGQEHTLPAGTCKPIPVSCPPSQDLFNNICVNKCQGNQIHTLPNGACIPPPNCPPTQELWNGICVNKCASPLFEHSLPNGACTPIFTLPIGPVLELCLGVNKELWEGKCVDKCPGNQVHTQPNGDCKPPFVGPIGPIGPIQIICLGVNKEVWENKCVDKCPAGQIHAQPNGDCKKIIQLPPNLGPIVGPVQISPAAQCALQNKDLYKGNCVDKCQGNQVHKDPDGACGPPVLNPNIPIGPIAPIQPLSPAALCAAQNKDLFNGNCVNKCPANLEHKQPNGACGPIIGPIARSDPPAQQIQVVPTQATCAAQNKDLYAGKCVDKCGANQEHKAPNGACGPIIGPIQVIPRPDPARADAGDLRRAEQGPVRGQVHRQVRREPGAQAAQRRLRPDQRPAARSVPGRSSSCRRRRPAPRRTRTCSRASASTSAVRTRSTSSPTAPAARSTSSCRWSRPRRSARRRTRTCSAASASTSARPTRSATTTACASRGRPMPGRVRLARGAVRPRRRARWSSHRSSTSAVRSASRPSTTRGAMPCGFATSSGGRSTASTSRRLQHRSWRFDSEVCSLGIAASGRLVLALRKRVGLFDPEGGSFALLAEIETDRPQTRLNDGKVGAGRSLLRRLDRRRRRSGRPIGALYRIDPAGPR